ncbi:hypothetical protein, variant 2 [Phytophthora nicotianae P10297]|uniref:HTH psq-type domain-containing protein n=2 Tax=Phytophthora nicotianae TaxID=4792 RepID=W2YHF6_PHYNI|nr:hypothetical protein, variant 2 [Phytophthora nicotianae P10297]
MDNSPPKKKKKKQRSYSVRKKRDAVRRIQEVGVEEVARELQCVRGTAHGWCQQADKLLSFTGHATSKTMKRKGRKELFPDVAVIVTFMKVKHRAELVSSNVCKFYYILLNLSGLRVIRLLLREELWSTCGKLSLIG